MAEYKLGRIRFVWKGAWTTGTQYFKDDVVRLGGRTYICQVGHVASNDFYTDLDYNPTKWNQMTDGITWADDWSTSTSYNINDVVRYGAIIYICNTPHTSSVTTTLGLESDQSKWDVFSEGTDWKGEWTINTRYRVNDVVKYGGYTYVCNAGHTSAGSTVSGLEADQSKWDTYNPGIEYKGLWSGASFRYKLNDVVKYGAGLYICTTQHASTSNFVDDQSNWGQFVKGFEFEQSWVASTNYQIGDIVTYGGNQYIAKANHASENLPPVDSTNWDVFSEGFNFADAWTLSTSYKIGDVVTLSGNSYLATADSPSIATTVTSSDGVTEVFTAVNTTGMVPGMVVRFSGVGFGNVFIGADYYIRTVPSITQFTISEVPGGPTKNVTAGTGTMTATVAAHPTNTNFWALLNKGFNWRGEWQDDVEYNPGDTVRFNSNAYLCVAKHRSEQDDGSSIIAEGGGADNSRPDQDSLGLYWNLLVVGSETDVLIAKGDLVFYGGAGPTRLPVGQEGQILRVSENHTPEWATLGLTDYEYFVAPHGQDHPSPIWGRTFDKPWKTIRYACEQVEKGPRNPETQKILELNRVFIQREVSKWLEHQITNSISPFSNVTVTDITTSNTLTTATNHGLTAGRRLTAKDTANGLVTDTVYYVVSEGLTSTSFRVSLTRGGAALASLVDGTGLSINMIFDFDEYKCERDVGFIVDALIYDLGHGGNIKTRGAANSYVEGLTPEETEVYTAGLVNESVESIAALNYMLALVQDVLNQDAPVVNYQILNGDNSTAIVEQHFDDSLSAESGSYATISELVTIVIDAIREGSPTNIPARYSPTNLINVATGRYREVLPIIVPEQTCVKGSELRSTNAGPAAAGDRTTDISDSKYSLGALGRMETVVSEIIQGIDVTESTGNIETQSMQWPYSDSVTTVDATRLIRTIQQNIDFRLGTTTLIASQDPVGYNGSFLNGFGNARKLIIENKKYLQEEIVAYITQNFPAVKYSKTICKRDVGYIVDAIVYDLTYGGNSQSINAGLAYYDGSSGSLMIDSSELSATISAYNYLKIVMQQVAANNAAPILQNAIPQFRDTAGSAAAVTQIGVLLDTMIAIVQNGPTSAPNVTVTGITATDTLITGSNHNLLVGDSFTPRSSVNGLIKNVKYWVVNVPSATQFKVSASFGGSAATFTNGSGLSITGDVVDHPAATDGVTSTTALITAAQTLDAAQEIIIENVIDDLNTVAWHTDFVVAGTGLTNDDFVIYVGKHSLAHTYVDGGTVTKSNGTILQISNFVYNHTTGYATVTTSTDHSLEAGDIVDIEDIHVSCSSGGNVAIAEFPNQFGTQNGITKIFYKQNKCIRDTRLILEAVAFDFMFDSNFQSTKAAYSYLRSSATEVFTLGQKTITRDALDNAKTEALANVGGDTTAQSRIAGLMTILDDVIFSGSNEGSRCATDLRAADYAVLQLERNRNFITAEISAWIAATYTDTVTAVAESSDTLTITDTGWLQRNAAIRFSGTLIGGLDANTTYYVQNVISSTVFTIAETRNATDPLDITADESGSMTVRLHYNSELCLRDVGTYIDALKYDLKYPGNYKSLFAARYYTNAIKGSLEEDMFYLRDATGLRDMTLEGLTGDLLAPNEFGTSRVSAGAYASLDPGWGPQDYRTWIQTRSPYVQGLTTFGYAAIGQKIDGALHAGGNDSITSNDFTQVISDGIGAWVANNGRAELVSVFTYYAHIGYLATEGGRIRGTNGNNSYGDFGSVAEGVDPTETAGLAVVDNQFQFVSTVGSVFGDGSKFFQLEFENAGIDYSEHTWTFTGGGTGAAVENDEYRDNGVYAVRLQDLGDDSSGQFGGQGYISNANTAQGGTSTSLTLAATDGEVSGAYVGMALYLTGGSGVGQYGFITSYNAGTKLATVVRENGSSGWEHVIPGTTIATPDASTTYVVEPRIIFSSPAFASTSRSFNVADVPYAIEWVDTSASYVSVSGTYAGMLGSGATFTVVRNTWKYIPTLQAAGSNYARLETITIPGTSLGGVSPANDLVITITAVDAVNGSILEFDHDGFGLAGKFLGWKYGTNKIYHSIDAVSWTEANLPSTSNWVGLSSGLIDDGSSFQKRSKQVIFGTGTVAAHSDDGISWTSTTLPRSGQNWVSAYGNNRFVAVTNDVSAARPVVSLDGEVWDIIGDTNIGDARDITYGRGLFVVVQGNSTNAWTSPDGIVWTQRTLPASSNWSSVTWGNNKFIAVASNSDNGAYSFDGITWTSVAMGSPDSTTPAGYQKVRYGQGLFMATLSSGSLTGYSFVATSEDGINWDHRDVDSNVSHNGWKELAFGTPQRTGHWVAVCAQATTFDSYVVIDTGAKARARAFVAEEKIFAIRITEPGSGYTEIPTMTIVDPNNIYEAPNEIKLGRGVIAQPSWLNRGNQYATASAEIFSGDGYANFVQSGSFVAVRRMTFLPATGSNIVFAGLPGRTFKLVNVITFLGTNDGAYTSFYQVSPDLSIQEASQLEHLSGVETRIRYSQVRLTGHDFLDIGTGNFVETNYPGLPTQDPIQANETADNNGGRVFFTATDQDGNFRVGDLFSIEQSTGVATLNADAFNISGLQELNLGDLTLGGGSATVTEFSTDPFFTADSDSVVPTQRAIKAFIAAQIGGGGAALNVNSVTAGSIKISSNTIENIAGTSIKMDATFEFRGGVIGLPIAFHYFLT